MKTGEDRTAENPKVPRLLSRRVKLVDEIIETLRQDIVTRRRSDGERLPTEKELSDRFGCGQSTIREAIRALETLGLVEVLHGNGSFVRSQGDFALASALQTFLQLQSVSVMEALQIRQVLGRQSIAMAAINATDRDIAEIAAICGSFERLGDVKDVDGVLAQVVSFQRAVSSAARSPLLQSLEAFLLALLHEVQVQSLGGRGIRFWRARAMAFQPHRLAILDGLRSKDPALASAAMDRYFDAQRTRFEQVKDLHALSLSDPRVINVIANMVRQFRT